jgi:hypothetical protein
MAEWLKAHLPDVTHEFLMRDSQPKVTAKH